MELVKATTENMKQMMSSRLEMLKVVKHLPEDYEFDKEFVSYSERYFESPDQTTVLMIDGKEVVGCATMCYITVMPTFDHPSGKRAHVMNVYTRSTHRRMGIGKQMMDYLLREAKEKGVTIVTLDATSMGRPLYETCGFTPSSEGMTRILH